MKLKQFLMVVVTAISLASCSKKDSDFIIFSLPNLNFSANGGEKEFSINYSGDWTVTIPASGDWIESVTPKSGKGNATVKVKAKANNTKERRKTELQFNEQQFLVSQQIGVIDIKLVYGNWATEDESFKFQFNEDKTCEAILPMGKYTGTYDVDGNIIVITIPNLNKKVEVVVLDISDATMLASTAGKELVLKNII